MLMTVAALESLGMVYNFGSAVQSAMDNRVFVVLLGTASAIIDNVPLVAAAWGCFTREWTRACGISSPMPQEQEEAS